MRFEVIDEILVLFYTEVTRELVTFPLEFEGIKYEIGDIRSIKEEKRTACPHKIKKIMDAERV
jgi:hypothetical protein